MNPIAELMNRLLSSNSQVANNPRNKGMIDVIQNGDNTKGEEIARNLCRTYGVTPEEAIQRAKAFFGIR